MSRVRTFFTLVLPSMLVGGLVFGPALSQAHDGRDNLIAYADDGGSSTDTPRRAPPRETAQAPVPPPRPPRPPRPPTPPTPPGQHGGITVNVNGNKIDLSGIGGMVRGQLDGAREMIRNNPNIPPKLRDKILARIDRVRATVDKRLSKLKGKGLEEMGEELEQMGDEIEEAMEGLDDELEQLGDQLGKDIGKNIGKHFKGKNFKFKFDFDDEADDVGGIPMAPDLDELDDGEMGDALDDLKGLAIKPQQREQISKIRAKADQEVAAARRQLDDLSNKFEAALGNSSTSDEDIRRYVDQISAQEAVIRKARILAWVNARRVLDDGQRKRIEAAASKRGK